MNTQLFHGTDGTEGPLIRKEIVFRSFDESIGSVHIGFLPPTGRYFVLPMRRRDRHSFELEVLLPKGKTFYHYFFNGDLTAPQNTGTMLPHDTQKRAALVLETPVFCPVQFANDPSFVNHITGRVWEFRAITHQSWIREVELVAEGERHVFIRAFTDKNKTYWTARPEPRAGLRFCIRIAGSGQEKFLHADRRLYDQPIPSLFFELQADHHRSEPAPFFRAGYQVLPDRYGRLPVSGTDDAAPAWGSEEGLDRSFGGNFKGLTADLGRIAELGVDFIYLNPVFSSGTYHRYDCNDFRAIDPMLGTEDDLRELVDTAHRRGLRIVLDICLNHCSTEFFAFRDVIEKGEASPYRNWFELHGFPVSVEAGNYSCWHGHRHLPQFNFNEPQVVDYFMETARYWTSGFGIDGWRLDVCTELPPDFVRRFSAVVRAVNPNIVIIGETWQSQLRELSYDGDVDGITNYALYLDAMLPFFGQEVLPVAKLAAAVMRALGQQSFRTSACSWNFLGNHDLPRFYSLLKNKELYLAAFTLLYALPGVPVIYYGEEWRMEGLADPDNRRCLPLEAPAGTQKIVDGLRNLNRLRARHAQVLALGSISIPYTSEKKKLLVLNRTLGEEQVCFIFNFGDRPQSWLHELPGEGPSDLVQIPPFSATYFYVRTKLFQGSAWERMGTHGSVDEKEINNVF